MEQLQTDWSPLACTRGGEGVVGWINGKNTIIVL